MESQTEQDSGGIAVITLDGDCFLSMRHVLVCQESGHEAGFLRVFAGLENRLLELGKTLHSFGVDASSTTAFAVSFTGENSAGESYSSIRQQPSVENTLSRPM